MVAVKICGINDGDALKAVAFYKAAFAGFVFYPPSPRHAGIELAASLTAELPRFVKAVGLFVDPDDEYLEKVLESVSLDMIQLHGTESPHRVRQIKTRYNLPVMKAVSIDTKADLKQAKAYERVADWMLFDSRPQHLPGGTGQSFDWQLLRAYKHIKPWMLAGGLTAENLPEALGVLSPDAVDVSSGVEVMPGMKSPMKIQEFIETAHYTG